MRHVPRALWFGASAVIVVTLSIVWGLSTNPSRVGPFLFITLLAAGVIGVVWLNYKSGEAFGLTRVTSLHTDDIIERLVGHYIVNGWQVTSQTARGATFYRRSNPSILLTLVLFVFGIVPGLIYLFLGGGDLTVAVTTRRQGDGRIEVDIVGNSRGDGSFRIAKEMLDGLP